MNSNTPSALLVIDTCDICGDNIIEGERFSPADESGPAEHKACTADWFRRNFGREGLS